MRHPLPVALLTTTLFALTAACAADESTTTPTPTAEATAPAAHAVEFGYAGDEGPEHWSELSPEFAECADTTRQSPIDLSGARSEPRPDPEFRYTAGTVELTNTTHTVHAEESTGSTLVLDGQESALAQFHLHEPSEHTVDGTRFDAELHLVHRDAAGAVTVVGILFRRGAENAALQPYLDALPTTPGETAELTGFDPTSLLPASHDTFRYTGSLTTPPCTEGVQWVVLTSPVDISAEQLAAFRDVIEENDRPVQEVGERTIVLDAADS